MPLPPKLFYPICEVATRWSVSPIDIVGWRSMVGSRCLQRFRWLRRNRAVPSKGWSKSPARTFLTCSMPGRTRSRPSAFSGSGAGLAHGGRRSSRQPTASRSSHQASSSPAPKPNASSASMESLGSTQRMINKRQKPATGRSASPAHPPVTTGMPSPAPSHGGFTMEACLRVRANWSATCSIGLPRQVGFRMRAQSAGVCRHCGRC